MPDWFQNDDLFLRELGEGHRQAERVAATLRQADIEVTVTPMEVRARVEERGEWADEFDLLVGRAKPCAIDVKSRALVFAGPADYPYPTALVDTYSGWQQKMRKPLAIVLVSQMTGGMAVIRVSGQAEWTTRRRFDNVRGIEDQFLEVEKNQLASFEEFVDWLREREQAAVP